MLLNRIEKLIVVNPLRALLQRRIEARKLLAMGGRMRGGRALEVGCGPGFGVRIILDLFGAGSVDAFDIDPEMVGKAEKSALKNSGLVRFWTGDVTAIPAEDNTYDAVFDFFIIHHVPEWKKALGEIRRVLKPGGRFYGEEVLSGLLSMKITQVLTEHPREGFFTLNEFSDALQEAGLTLVAKDHFGTWAGWFIADKPR